MPVRKKSAPGALQRPRQGPNPPSPITFQGRYVTLGPVAPADYPQLYAWRTDIEHLALWSLRARHIVAYDQFRQALEGSLRGEAVTLAVRDRTSGHLGGFVRLYDANWIDGWAWVGCFAGPDDRHRPKQFGEAMVMFFDYVFSHFPLRKVYAEIADYNSISRRIATRMGFRLEGSLRDHIWLKDRFWKVGHFALTREDWAQSHQRYARLARGIQNEVG